MRERQKRNTGKTYKTRCTCAAVSAGVCYIFRAETGRSACALWHSSTIPVPPAPSLPPPSLSLSVSLGSFSEAFMIRLQSVTAEVLRRQEISWGVYFPSFKGSAKQAVHTLWRTVKRLRKLKNSNFTRRCCFAWHSGLSS